MSKISFQYLYSFKYHDKEYIFLTAKNYPFYFLGYDNINDSFIYPEFDIFKELYSKFYLPNHIVLFNKKELKQLHQILFEKNISIVPLIKTTSGLISLAMALSMCGCQKTDNIPDISSSDSSIVESSLTEESRDKEQQIKEYFQVYDMDVIDKEYNNCDYIFVRDYINNRNKHYITLQDFDELCKYCHLDFQPTWDDVIKAFKDNNNIDNGQKQIIFEAIANLQKREELKEIDLSVLYINAKKMSIQYLTSDEINANTNSESAYAYFDAITGIVYLPNDKPFEKFQFIHEVLGHGTLAFQDETIDSIVVFDCTNYIMLPEDGRYVGYLMGAVVSEGGANIIAHFATNDYSVHNYYELYEEELRVIASLCHVSIGELFNHKGISCYDLMYQNKIDTPVEYIFKMDALFKGQFYCEFSDLMERLFIDATEERIKKSDNKKQEQIIKETINIIRDSYFKAQGGLAFVDKDSGGFIKYDLEEMADRYDEAINQFKNK